MKLQDILIKLKLKEPEVLDSSNGLSFRVLGFQPDRNSETPLPQISGKTN